ncbi:hypothetical protein HanPI659440_Chr11g0411001 [Helianthus annuus]|nr:hypothetical protein HanPI659440_Chr11g0411001 [Helianthus annuus]
MLLTPKRTNKCSGKGRTLEGHPRMGVRKASFNSDSEGSGSLRTASGCLHTILKGTIDSETQKKRSFQVPSVVTMDEMRQVSTFDVSKVNQSPFLAKRKNRRKSNKKGSYPRARHKTSKCKTLAIPFG